MENAPSAQLPEKLNAEEYDLVILGGGTGSTTGSIFYFYRSGIAPRRLSEEEAKAQSIAYRLFKIPMEAAMRASTNVGKHGERHQNAYPFGETEAIVSGLANPQRQFTLLRKTR